MTPSFTASGPALGYLYQVRYALHMLMERGRDSDQPLSVKLESIDDLTFTDLETGDPKELLQLKHKSDGANLSNSSPDLWGTIRIWIDHLQKNQYDHESPVLTLVTTQSASPDSIAEMLKPGSDVESLEVIERMIKVTEESSSSKNEKAYSLFRDLDRSKKVNLIESINVVDSSSDIGDAREDILNYLDLFVDPDEKEPFYNRLEGWWFNKAVEQLSGQYDRGVSYEALRGKISSLRDQFVEDNLPADFITPLEISEEDLDSSEKTFMRQLEIIAVNKERIRHAIDEYYRACKQRSKWARDGLIIDSDIQKYEQRLKREWRDHFIRMKENIQNDTSETEIKEKGKKLYNRIRDEVDEYIKPKFNESYHQRGSYHILANQKEVGWHKEFIERLQDIAEEAESPTQ